MESTPKKDNFIKDFYSPQPDQLADVNKMYQLADAPPPMPLNDYIVKYKQSGDELYLRYFLHCYEPGLNKFIYKQCADYKLNCHFENVKQAVISAIIQLIPTYDLSVGTTLLQYAEKYIEAALDNFDAKEGGAALSLNPNQYRRLKQVAAIYYSSFKLTEKERFSEITAQTGISEKDAQAIIIGGENFRYPLSMDYTVCDEDGGKGEPVAEKIPSLYDNPASLVPRFLFYDDMVEIIEDLDDQPKTMLLASLGILCLYCGRLGEEMPQQDIANMYELYSARAVQKQNERTREILAKALMNKGWFRVMKIRQAKKKEHNEEMISAIYSYRPMFGNEEGSLEFDLTLPAKDGYTIDRLTSWDKQYSYFKKLVAEVSKMQKSGQYAKEKLIVWWL